jgi:hypothetical protein
VVVAVIVTVAMIVVVVVIPMVMTMVVRPMVVMVGVALHLAVTASADCAHHAISRSLIRISSPDTGMSRPPPQSGQGSRRWSISTVPPQS